MIVFEEFMRNVIKYFDIGLLGVYYLFGAVTMVSFLNAFFQRLYKRKKVEVLKNVELILQIALQAFIIMIFSNILRKFIRSVPFPLEGVYNYKHLSINETNGGIIIAFAMMTSFIEFRKRVVELVRRITESYEFNYIRH
tara:strand:- start:719 stop:1135 length:417 start_codon:yes stop_codon:yes gene_type:complete